MAFTDIPLKSVATVTVHLESSSESLSTNSIFFCVGICLLKKSRRRSARKIAQYHSGRFPPRRAACLTPAYWRPAVYGFRVYSTLVVNSLERSSLMLGPIVLVK